MVRLLICCKGKYLFLTLQTFSHFFSKNFSSCLPPPFLLPSSSLPPRFLMPSYSLPPRFLLAYTHIYIAGYFSTPEKKSPFEPFTLFKKLFSEIVWPFGLEFITLQPDTSKRRRNNGNERREMYQRARKQRKRVARYTRYLTYGLIANKC